MIFDYCFSQRIKVFQKDKLIVLPNKGNSFPHVNRLWLTTVYCLVLFLEVFCMLLSYNYGGACVRACPPFEYQCYHRCLTSVGLMCTFLDMLEQLFPPKVLLLPTVYNLTPNVKHILKCKLLHTNASLSHNVYQ